MFKKLKDKLAEEVKSSPQRIQQFAQAAQAAVTSASSSISDITNSDLFTIGDNDMQQSRPGGSQPSPSGQQNMFQDVSLIQSPPESVDFSHEIGDGQRQRRLSNSSFASDVSFRLPSYETPSMYHLQSDMEVSASEADERGFSGSPATLDRVTKEQLYAAYRRTQERYKKYRTQYGDLARHYKLLERENAKARSVLVETQDKALRRISELKEQCTLEQSAKAHLEKALRVEIEEKNMKIEALNTKVQLLQSNTQLNNVDNINNYTKSRNVNNENEVQLIDLDNENAHKSPSENSGSEVTSLNNKIEKMEHLLNKYKESLKVSKEKNSQITTELQIISKEIENKNKQIQDFKSTEDQLNEAKVKIDELYNVNEELQNKINSFDFTKTKELSTLELDLQKANEEITELRSKIEVFSKKEEEYAISLAENKLSIHKELEDKEAEIKSLKDSLTASKKEVQSLKIVIDDYKNNILRLEEEKNRLHNECAEVSTVKTKLHEMETKLQEFAKKSQSLEQMKTKADEEYKCLQLQLKQETAEKLAMIDRNLYLETKNTQLSEENTKKNTRISHLENEMQVFTSIKEREKDLILKETEKSQLLDELNTWKTKCGRLELEIQEERDELVKLQTEIEKLLSNHESIQAQNAEFRSTVSNLSTECSKLEENNNKNRSIIRSNLQKTINDLKDLRQIIFIASNDTKECLKANKGVLSSLTQDINTFISHSFQQLFNEIETATTKYNNLKLDYDNLQAEIAKNRTNKIEVSYELETLQKENDSLKIKLEQNESDKNTINNELKDISQKYEGSLAQIKLLSSNTEVLTKKIEEMKDINQEIRATFEKEKTLHLATAAKTYEAEKQNLKDTIQTLECQNTLLCMESEQLKDQHKEALDELAKKYEEILKNKEEEIKISQNIQRELDIEMEQHLITVEQLKQLESERDQLNLLYNSMEDKNIKLSAEIEELKREYEMANAKINELNNDIFDKTSLLEKSQQIEISLKKEIAQYVLSSNTITEVEKDKQNLMEKLKSIEDKTKVLNTELDELRKRHKTAENIIQTVNAELTNKSNECDIKQVQINALEETVRTLSQENTLLKTETANFTSNIKELESEIEDIRKSHSEIVTEKDHLNEIIEKLERKQIDANILFQDNKHTQTDDDGNDKITEDEPSAVFENKWILENKQNVMSNTASLNLKKDNAEDLYEQYSSVKINYDTLKDENRRLQSDIEGLQTYLTKISKENSVLNDKLRELIASSEHSTDSDQLSNDVKQLKNEVEASKEKMNDLLRENSLLIEENLELKDQLLSQNYSKPTDAKNVSNNDKDFDTLKVKYNNLLQTIIQLEQRTVDLEQINKSVNGNMQQLQEKNERLRLSNEKLERRLDEALVSLRHLHSLQENTELEYLRNILYEYLTGSGTHSVTLAKVLSAIVKFDDIQTQMVLQKEKERQGFLRQLGII